MAKRCSRAMAKDLKAELDELRAEIDRADDEILALLNRRAGLVGESPT